MSNVLKVSLQTTIYSLADRGWVAANELRASWGSIAKRCAGICAADVRNARAEPIAEQPE
jgi:hypothetical protein